jgi:putative hydrolase of the HAD superfamily
MAMTAKPLPRAMLIYTILPAYRRPEIAWNTIATEFASQLAPLPPEQVAAAILTFVRNFRVNAKAA